MYYWDEKQCIKLQDLLNVSVVVRRMYYWDCLRGFEEAGESQFQQLLEECTIGTRSAFCVLKTALTFQQLLEECTIGTEVVMKTLRKQDSFSSCQKNVLLGPAASSGITRATLFQQLLEECTIGTTDVNDDWGTIYRFSSCQKNVLLGLNTMT